MNVVIVESPAKAKTINKYLGPEYEVIASYGHVRDLPPKDGSVSPDDDFKMIWQVDPKAQKRLNEIAASVKDAEKLILATDPDREGEAISWHVLEILKGKKVLEGKKIERVVFNAITKQSVSEAMANPREIDAALVDAYLARRALDYLVGFTLSPVLWRKLPGSRSAGRVQSVALRLVCDRELEIEKFQPREYWSIEALLATPRNETFTARLIGADGKKIQRLDIGSGDEAKAFKDALEKAQFKVNSVESKPAKRHPYAPFSTSTMQQEASRKLGFAPAITMRLAQRLYEGADIGGETVGLITYMRTDGIELDGSAIAGARRVIEAEYGANYVPSSPRVYKNKSKHAQEAHEAVRPTDLSRKPKDVARYLEPDQAKLYELIWLRTIASQMESAELERTTVDITANVAGRTLDLRATGTIIKFDGFLALYHEDQDDPTGDDEDANRLPEVKQGETLQKREIKADRHFTEPPPRFSEASLVKRMEELGIGRPSTYASTLQVLRDRGYVRVDKKRLIPEDKGRVLTVFLESFFQKYVEYDFTASLEEKLDEIANHDLDWKEVLRDFWRDFIAAVEDIKELRISNVIDALDEMLAPHIFPPREDGSDPRLCPTCGTGRLGLKMGRFGSFVGCSNYPECRHTRPLNDSSGVTGTKVLGTDPATGKEVTLRGGRFGPYVQLGEQDGDEKPKRAGLPKGTDLDAVTLEFALGLLALPRDVGPHPEDGEMITAGIGRFGAYVKHGSTYANLEEGDEVMNIGLNRAVTLLAEKSARPSRKKAAAGTPLGEHPSLGGPVTRHDGRYGPYVKHGKVNATIPGSIDPLAITLEQAVELIKTRAEKTGVKQSAAKKPKAAKAKKRTAAKTEAEKSSEEKPKKDKNVPRPAKKKKKEDGAVANKETEPAE